MNGVIFCISISLALDRRPRHLLERGVQAALCERPSSDASSVSSLLDWNGFTVFPQALLNVKFY
jgi:hypothetical protein